MNIEPPDILLDPPMDPDQTEPEIADEGQASYLPATVDPQPNGRQMRLQAREQFGQQMDDFAQVLIAHCERLRYRCYTAKNDRRYYDRMILNERRARNHAYIQQRPSGVVDKRVGDGHLSLGILQGRSASAISAMKSHLYRTLFESSEKPYVFKGAGEKAENGVIPDVLESVTDHFFRVSGIGSHAQDWSLFSAKLGTGLARCEMTQPVWAERTEKGFARKVEPLRPEIRVYHTDDVEVTNQACSRANEQELVFFVRRNVTYYDLAPDEALVSYDETTGMVHESGKFFDIDLMLADAPQQGENASIYNREPYLPRTESSFEQKVLIEVQGALPMRFWAKEGKLTPEIAALMMIPLDLPERPQKSESPTDEETKADDQWMELFVEAVGLVPSWRIAYLLDQYNVRSDGSGRGTLHQLEASPTAYTPNDLYRFAFGEQGNEFLGESIVDIGFALEDASDNLFNETIRGAMLMANPPVGHDRSLLDKDADLTQFFKPGGRVECKGDPSEIVKVLERNFQTQNVMMVIQAINVAHEDATGVSATLKGTDNPAGETLGQTQIKDSRATGIADDIALRHVKELHRMIMFGMLIPYAEIAGFDEPKLQNTPCFLELCARCSGKTVEEIAEHMPNIESLRTEWEIEHPMSLGQDKAVMAQQMQANITLLPEQYDRRKSAIKLTKLVGDRNPDDWMVDAPDPMPVETQHEQLALGNYVSPHKLDDHIMELTAHTMEFQRVSSGDTSLPNGQMIADPQTYLKLLDRHISEHKMLWQMLNVEMAQQGAAGGAQAMPGDPSMPAGASQQAGELTSTANAAPNPQPMGGSRGAAAA